MAPQACAPRPLVTGELDTSTSFSSEPLQFSRNLLSEFTNQRVSWSCVVLRNIRASGPASATRLERT